MSAQDKIERTLKQIHVLLSGGESVSGNPDKVIVDKKEVFAILEQLNLAIYDIMDQYEVTNQSREMAERRSAKKGEEMVERISQQAEDVYAASLIYTDDALNKVQRLMADAMESSRNIWHQFSLELEKEKRKVREDQMELREQLQDFKDSNKYLVMIEDCNRERQKQEKDQNSPDKKIQNEAKHYAMNGKPEIRVNPAYFERRKSDMPPVSKGTAVEDIPPMPKGLAVGDIPPMPVTLEEEPEKSFVMPEIKVDLDAEYFKWQEEEANVNKDPNASGKASATTKKERKFLFGKK